MSRTRGHFFGPVVLLTCAGLVASIMALVLAYPLTQAAAADPTAPKPVYTVTSLGTLGGSQSIARDINKAGQVTGQSQNALGQNRGFLWEDGKGMKPIGTLGGPTSPARGINKDGKVVGFSRISSLSTNTQVRAYLAQNGSPTNLGTLTGLSNSGTPITFSNSEAWHINDSGVAVGRSFNSTTEGRAVLWENGQIKNVGGEYLKTPYSEAWSINNLGQVVGEAGVADQQAKAFLYDNDTNQVTDIDAAGRQDPDHPVFPYQYSEAMGINNLGQVVGWSYRTTDPDPEGKAFLYEKGKDGAATVVPLEPLDGDAYSRARDIDESGRIVGWSRGTEGNGREQFSATIWEDGKVTDLNDLIPANSRWRLTGDGKIEGWKLVDAYAINETGQIVGSGYKDGNDAANQIQAFLLTPDITAPALTVGHTADGSNDWNKTSPVSVTVSASDNTGGSGLAGDPTCTDGSTSLSLTAGSTAGTWTASVSGEGTHNISCSVSDNANNSANATDTVKIDTAPIPSLTSANRYSNSSPITVNYSTTNASSDFSGLKKVELWAKGPSDGDFVKVDEKTTASGSFSYAANQDDGDYRFYTIAEDNAGNREVQPPSADAIVTVTHDTVAPTLSVTHTADGSNGWNKTSPVSVTVSASDSGSGLDGAPACTDGSTALSLTAGEWTASVSGDGTHDISCSVSDKATNTTTKTDTVKIDTIKPTITKSNIKNADGSAYTVGSWTNQTVTATFGCSDAGSGPVATSLSDSTTSEGANLTLSGTCQDQAGYSSDTASYDPVKVDKTADITSQAIANAYSNTSPIEVSYTTDPHGDISGLKEVELFAQGPQDTSPQPVSGTMTAPSGDFNYAVTQGDGTYRFYTRAADNAGNLENAPVTPDAIVTHDTAAPNLSVGHTANGNNGWNTSSPVSVSVTASDSGSDLAGAPDCKDGTTKLTLTGSAGSWTASVSGDGTHDISCSVKDNADNSNRATDTVKIDQTRPSVASTDPLSKATGVSAKSNIEAIFSEEGSGIDSNTLTDSTFNVVQVKPTGNVTISGIVSYEEDSKMATFDPSNSLAKGLYKATITTGVKDKAGNALSHDYTWQFATAGPSNK